VTDQSPTEPAPSRLPSPPWEHELPFDPARARDGGFAKLELHGRRRHRFGFVRTMRAFDRMWVQIWEPIVDDVGALIDWATEIHDPQKVARVKSLSKAAVMQESASRRPLQPVAVGDDPNNQEDPDDGDSYGPQIKLVDTQVQP